MITVDGRNKYFDVDIVWLHKRYIFSAQSYYRLTIRTLMSNETVICRTGTDHRSLAWPSDLYIYMHYYDSCHDCNRSFHRGHKLVIHADLEISRGNCELLDGSKNF